jgi:adenosylcobinamide kinase/adenosylcobinamide-phosphate guanylyltransferase
VPSAVRGAEAVVIDCVTVWVANRLLRGDAADAVHAEAGELAALLTRVPFDVTIVSNEVGEGVHPETAMGLRFRDVLGIVNQRLAAACDTAVLMVAGLPLTLKTAMPPRDEPVQAP